MLLRIAAPHAAEAVAEPLARVAGPLSLSAPSTRAPLLVPEGRPALAGRLRSRAAGERIVLVLSGLRTDLPPGVVYSVALVGPNTRVPVGTLNFFDATARERRFNADVTDALAAFGPEELPQLSLEFTAQGPPEAGARPVVGDAALIRHKPPP